MAEATLTVEELTAMLSTTAHHHHQAFHESDGIDPDWALWYASHLQGIMWDRAGEIPTRAKLVQILMNSDEEFVASGSTDEWHPFYAANILKNVGG